jgi:hypothetical protein
MAKTLQQAHDAAVAAGMPLPPGQTEYGPATLALFAFDPSADANDEVSLWTAGATPQPDQTALQAQLTALQAEAAQHSGPSAAIAMIGQIANVIVPVASAALSGSSTTVPAIASALGQIGTIVSGGQAMTAPATTTGA